MATKYDAVTIERYNSVVNQLTEASNEIEKNNGVATVKLDFEGNEMTFSQFIDDNTNFYDVAKDISGLLELVSRAEDAGISADEKDLLVQAVSNRYRSYEKADKGARNLMLDEGAKALYYESIIQAAEDSYGPGLGVSAAAVQDKIYRANGYNRATNKDSRFDRYVSEEMNRIGDAVGYDFRNDANGAMNVTGRFLFAYGDRGPEYKDLGNLADAINYSEVFTRKAPARIDAVAVRKGIEAQLLDELEKTGSIKNLLESDREIDIRQNGRFVFPSVRLNEIPGLMDEDRLDFGDVGPSVREISKFLLDKTIDDYGHYSGISFNEEDYRLADSTVVTTIVDSKEIFREYLSSEIKEIREAGADSQIPSREEIFDNVFGMIKSDFIREAKEDPNILYDGNYSLDDVPEIIEKSRISEAVREAFEDIAGVASEGSIEVSVQDMLRVSIGDRADNVVAIDWDTVYAALPAYKEAKKVLAEARGEIDRADAAYNDSLARGIEPGELENTSACVVVFGKSCVIPHNVDEKEALTAVLRQFYNDGKTLGSSADVFLADKCADIVASRLSRSMVTIGNTSVEGVTFSEVRNEVRAQLEDKRRSKEKELKENGNISSEVIRERKNEDLFTSMNPVIVKGVRFGEIQEYGNRYMAHRIEDGSIAGDGGFETLVENTARDVFEEIRNNEMSNSEGVRIVAFGMPEVNDTVFAYDGDFVRDLQMAAGRRAVEYVDKINAGEAVTFDTKLDVGGNSFDVKVPLNIKFAERDENGRLGTNRDFGVTVENMMRQVADDVMEKHGSKVLGDLYERLQYTDKDVMFSDEWKKGEIDKVITEENYMVFPSGARLFKNFALYPKNNGWNPNFVDKEGKPRVISAERSRYLDQKDKAKVFAIDNYGFKPMDRYGVIDFKAYNESRLESFRQEGSLDLAKMTAVAEKISQGYEKELAFAPKELVSGSDKKKERFLVLTKEEAEIADKAGFLTKEQSDRLSRIVDTVVDDREFSQIKKDYEEIEKTWDAFNAPSDFGDNRRDQLEHTGLDDQNVPYEKIPFKTAALVEHGLVVNKSWAFDKDQRKEFYEKINQAAADVVFPGQSIAKETLSVMDVDKDKMFSLVSALGPSDILKSGKKGEKIYTGDLLEELDKNFYAVEDFYREHCGKDRYTGRILHSIAREKIKVKGENGEKDKVKLGKLILTKYKAPLERSYSAAGLMDAYIGQKLRIIAVRNRLAQREFSESNIKAISEIPDKEISKMKEMKYFTSFGTEEMAGIVASQVRTIGTPFREDKAIDSLVRKGQIQEAEPASKEQLLRILDGLKAGNLLGNHMEGYDVKAFERMLETGKSSITKIEAGKIINGHKAVSKLMMMEKMECSSIPKTLEQATEALRKHYANVSASLDSEGIYSVSVAGPKHLSVDQVEYFKNHGYSLDLPNKPKEMDAYRYAEKVIEADRDGKLPRGAMATLRGIIPKQELDGFTVYDCQAKLKALESEKVAEQKRRVSDMILKEVGNQYNKGVKLPGYEKSLQEKIPYTNELFEKDSKRLPALPFTLAFVERLSIGHTLVPNKNGIVSEAMAVKAVKSLKEKNFAIARGNVTREQVRMAKELGVKDMAQAKDYQDGFRKIIGRCEDLKIVDKETGDYLKGNFVPRLDQQKMYNLVVSTVGSMGKLELSSDEGKKELGKMLSEVYVNDVKLQRKFEIDTCNSAGTYEGGVRQIIKGLEKEANSSCLKMDEGKLINSVIREFDKKYDVKDSSKLVKAIANVLPSGAGKDLIPKVKQVLEEREQQKAEKRERNISRENREK